MGTFWKAVERQKEWTFLLLVWVGIASASTAFAQERVGESTALKLIPEDAAFYASALRMREQIEIVGNSKTLKEFLELSLVQDLFDELKDAWNSDDKRKEAIEGDSDNEIAPFLQLVDVVKPWFALPENKPLIELFQEMLSSEVFIYGDETYVDLFSFYPRLHLKIKENPESDDKRKSVEFGIMAKYRDNRADKTKKLENNGAHFANTVIGFKVKNPQQAIGQIARLEDFTRVVELLLPAMKGRFQREMIGDASYLTAKLDGTLIPWELIKEELEKNEFKIKTNGDPTYFIKYFTSNFKFAVSIGVRGDYLLVAIGDSNQHLANFGNKKPLLERPEFAPLINAKSQRFTSISYVSRELAEQFSKTEQFVTQVVDFTERIVKLTDLSYKMQTEIVADIKKWRDQVLVLPSAPSAKLGFTYLTSFGYEGFEYSQPKLPATEGSKPLTLLNHVGKDPIFFNVARHRHSPEFVARFDRWLRQLAYYYEKISWEDLSADIKSEIDDNFDGFLDDFEPLVVRWFETTRDVLLPALGDGQVGVVIDARAQNKQWFQALRASQQPLPMFELGVITSVSNSQALPAVAIDYFELVQQTLDALHKRWPDEFPQVNLPIPTAMNENGCRLASLAFPEEAGINADLALNAGVKQDVAAISNRPVFTMRLLEKTPPNIELLDMADKPLAAATYFNHAAFIDAVTPWIDYLAVQLGEDEEESTQYLKDLGAIAQLLKGFRSVASATYDDGPTRIRRTVWRFDDLEK